MSNPTTYVHKSLATKLALTIAATTSILAGAAALVLDHYGSQAVDESSVEHMEALAGALEGGYHAYDVEKKLHPVNDILAEIGHHPAVDTLQVFDAQGYIRHSLKPAEVGQQLSTDELGEERRQDGNLAMVRVFPMRSACINCHQRQASVGGIRILVNRERIQGALFKFRFRTGLTGAGIIATVVLVSVWLMRRWVLMPIRDLIERMKDAQAGDFLVRAPVTTDDEVGGLARSFNTMLAAITDLRVREVEAQVENASVEVEKRLGPQLEEKNRIIEGKNAELQVRVRDLALLQEVTRNLTSTLSLEEQLHIISELLAESLNYREFTLMMLDRGAGLLRVEASYGFPESMKVDEMTFAVGEGIAGLVAQTGHTLVVQDTSADSRYLQDKTRFTPKGSLLSVPMVSNGQVMGVLNVFKPAVDAFKKDEVELIESVASQAALGIANAKLFQETVELSMTDALTALPNRRALDARLDLEVTRALRYEHALSVLMIDVDHFKKYNDTHGHLLGDTVLRGVAQALCQMVRKADTVARYGGEEFVVILPRQDQKAAAEVAEKLRKGIRSREFEHMDSQPGGRLTVSVGVASCPQDARDVVTLLAAADAALYQAKRDGRDRVALAAAGDHKGYDGPRDGNGNT
jgi:diguanylate cyclase (GGDEF)-like protein